MPGLTKKQRDLRALLLIEEEEEPPTEKFGEQVKRLKEERQGPTGVKPLTDEEMIGL